MYFVLCSKCEQGLRVASIAPEDELSNVDDPRCHSCGAPAVFSDRVEPDQLHKLVLHDVTPAEAYAALNGLGLPHEQECGPLALQKLFVEQRVKRVAARHIRNTHRSIIDFIEFENGTRMYFAASTLGATVYRISPKHSYAAEVDRA